jgi:hypothetical protein
VGTLPTIALDEIAVPFISQIATLPEVSLQRMSDLPSELKSPVSAIVQTAGTLPTRKPANAVPVDKAVVEPGAIAALIDFDDTVQHYIVIEDVSVSPPSN